MCAPVSAYESAVCSIISWNSTILDVLICFLTSGYSVPGSILSFFSYLFFISSLFIIILMMFKFFLVFSKYPRAPLPVKETSTRSAKSTVIWWILVFYLFCFFSSMSLCAYMCVLCMCVFVLLYHLCSLLCHYSLFQISWIEFNSNFLDSIKATCWSPLSLELPPASAFLLIN